MDRVVISVFNMSVSASIASFIVILARFILRKSPKAFSYALWAVVLYHAICPFVFKSESGLFPNPETLFFINLADQTEDIADSSPAARFEAGFQADGNDFPAGTLTEGLFADPYAGTSSEQAASHERRAADRLDIKQAVLNAAPWIWLTGAGALALYALISLLRLKRRLYDAVRLCGGVYISDKIRTPFVFGILRPRIYIPAGIHTRDQMNYIIKHELAHIQRFDSALSLLAFAALSIHWFNPIIWLSYSLMRKDMEMACDEAVLKRSGEDIRCDYSQTLLTFSSNRQGLVYPVMFGSNNVKKRVKNVLNYKKPGIWSITACTALSLAIAAGCAVSGSTVETPNIFSSTDASDAAPPAAVLRDEPASAVIPVKTNILIAGEDQSGKRTDVIIVCSFDSRTKEINFVSVPRDACTTIPPDMIKNMADQGFNPPADGLMKMNAVNAYGGREEGVAYLRERIEELLSIDIDYAVKIDLAAFDNIIDELGGVYFEIPEPGLYYSDPYQDLYIDLKPGFQLLDGKLAEGLIRYRASYKNGDIDRIDVQKKFLKSMFNQILSRESFARNALTTAKALVKYVRTDFKITDIDNYIRYIGDIKTENMSFYTLPGTFDYINQMSYFVPDEQAVKELTAQVFE
ncbi:MAG: LCP family protein [Clostridiales bacterium]|nr:LCP family protein [Clostridiales bacterium]